MRGKLTELINGIADNRLIPAHAGKTFPQGFGDILGQAHPRACGENPIGVGRAVRPRGSSPRMRGKPSLDRPLGRSRRLIPAHAGKTNAQFERVCLSAAHPRACGENFALAMKVKHYPGSSPRMRGKHPGRDVVVIEHGLIPAHAGKTPMNSTI